MKNIETLEEFEAAVSSSNLTLVAATSKWCAPCHRAKPEIEKLAKEFKVDAVQFDLDHEVVGDSLRERLEIETLPSYVFFSDSAEVGRQEISSPTLLRVLFEKFTSKQTKKENEDNKEVKNKEEEEEEEAVQQQEREEKKKE